MVDRTGDLPRRIEFSPCSQGGRGWRPRITVRGAGEEVPVPNVRFAPPGRHLSALHQLDADAIGCSDVAQEAAVYAVLQLDGKSHTLRPKLGAKGREIAPIEETEMVGSPCVMAGEVGIGPDRSGGRRGFTGSPAADQDRHAAEIDEDLRGAAGDRVGGDCGAEHLDIPLGGCSRVFADDVHMIEFERRIAHARLDPRPRTPAGLPRVLLASILIIFLGSTCNAAASAQEGRLVVFAAASLKDALDEVNAAYRRDMGRETTTSYAASPTLAKQIEAVAPADIFISADLDWMDYLAKKNLIKAETRANLLGNQLVLIAPADSPIKLDVAPNFPLA